MLGKKTCLQKRGKKILTQTKSPIPSSPSKVKWSTPKVDATPHIGHFGQECVELYDSQSFDHAGASNPKSYKL